MERQDLLFLDPRMLLFFAVCYISALSRTGQFASESLKFQWPCAEFLHISTGDRMAEFCHVFLGLRRVGGGVQPLLLPTPVRDESRKDSQCAAHRGQGSW